MFKYITSRNYYTKILIYLGTGIMDIKLVLKKSYFSYDSQINY